MANLKDFFEEEWQRPGKRIARIFLVGDSQAFG
jgi:hypothetical protein